MQEPSDIPKGNKSNFMSYYTCSFIGVYTSIQRFLLLIMKDRNKTETFSRHHRLSTPIICKEIAALVYV